jgi:hypothetical protein
LAASEPGQSAAEGSGGGGSAAVSRI